MMPDVAPGTGARVELPATQPVGINGELSKKLFLSGQATEGTQYKLSTDAQFITDDVPTTLPHCVTTEGNVQLRTCLESLLRTGIEEKDLVSVLKHDHTLFAQLAALPSTVRVHTITEQRAPPADLSGYNLDGIFDTFVIELNGR